MLLFDITLLLNDELTFFIVTPILCLLGYILIKAWMYVLGQSYSDEPWDIPHLGERQGHEEQPLEIAEQSMVRPYYYPNEEIELPYDTYYTEESETYQ